MFGVFEQGCLWLEQRDLGGMVVNKGREEAGIILWGLLSHVKTLGLLSNSGNILTCFPVILQVEAK